jgi:hypothetical protein
MIPLATVVFPQPLWVPAIMMRGMVMSDDLLEKTGVIMVLSHYGTDKG